MRDVEHIPVQPPKKAANRQQHKDSSEANPTSPGTDKLLLVAAVLLGVSVTVSIYDLFL